MSSSAQRKACFQLLGRGPGRSAAGTGGLFWNAETVGGGLFGVLEFTLIFLTKIDPKWEAFGDPFCITFSIFGALRSVTIFLYFSEPIWSLL